jgi:hypothetical protein
MKTNNGYDLSRKWFDFAFEHSEVKCQHTALFMWIIELNNRLGWKEQFGLPTNATMEGLHIGNKRTYLAAVEDLCKWGFIEIIKESKNQYSSTLISICRSKKATALHTALDTALIQHSNGIDTSIEHSTAPIDKQRNQETKKQRNNRVVFTPPNENDVYNFMGEYSMQKHMQWPDEKINTEAAKFFNYYEANGWKQGRNQMKDWKASARNWMVNNSKFENSNNQKSNSYGTKPRFDNVAHYQNVAAEIAADFAREREMRQDSNA